MVPSRVNRLLSAALFLGIIDAASAQAETTITLGGGGNEHGTTLMLNQRIDRNVPRDQVQIELRIDMLGADPEQLQTQVQTLLASSIQKAKVIPK